MIVLTSDNNIVNIMHCYWLLIASIFSTISLILNVVMSCLCPAGTNMLLCYQGNSLTFLFLVTFTLFLFEDYHLRQSNMLHHCCKHPNYFFSEKPLKHDSIICKKCSLDNTIQLFYESTIAYITLYWQ